MSEPGQQPVFYYELGSPTCYLVAEQVASEFPVVPEWVPVSGAPDDVARSTIEDRAAELGLQPVRWPSRWPPDSALAMLAATYAKGIGRVVAFSLAAFRQSFAGGRDLGDEDTVLIAAAACEMHPAAVLKGASLRSVAAALEAAGSRAREAGVRALPAIQVEDQVFTGPDPLAEAARALGAKA